MKDGHGNSVAIVLFSSFLLSFDYVGLFLAASIPFGGSFYGSSDGAVVNGINKMGFFIIGC